LRAVEFGIDDRAIRRAFEIHRDEFLFAVADDAFEIAARRSPAQDRVEFVLGRRFLHDRDEIDHRDDRRGNAQRETVEGAFDLGDREVERFRCARRGRHDIGRGVARATQVLVRRVEDVLVVGVGVNRIHKALHPTELVDDGLERGRETIRRTRGVGDDVVLRGIVGAMVHAEDHRDVLALCGCGDDDFARTAAVDVGARFRGVREETGRFDDDVDA